MKAFGEPDKGLRETVFTVCVNVCICVKAYGVFTVCVDVCICVYFIPGGFQAVTKCFTIFFFIC